MRQHIIVRHAAKTIEDIREVIMHNRQQVDMIKLKHVPLFFYVKINALKNMSDGTADLFALVPEIKTSVQDIKKIVTKVHSQRKLQSVVR